MGETFYVQVKEILDDYSDEVVRESEEAVKKVAAEAVRRLKESSPKRDGGGKYASGWALKKENDRTYRVYNRTKPSLTHLLEYGHGVKPAPKHAGKKDHVDPKPTSAGHIRPVEEWANAEVERRIKEAITKA